MKFYRENECDFGAQSNACLFAYKPRFGYCILNGRETRWSSGKKPENHDFFSLKHQLRPYGYYLTSIWHKAGLLLCSYGKRSIYGNISVQWSKKQDGRPKKLKTIILSEHLIQSRPLLYSYMRRSNYGKISVQWSMKKMVVRQYKKSTMMLFFDAPIWQYHMIITLRATWYNYSRSLVVLLCEEKHLWKHFSAMK